MHRVGLGQELRDHRVTRLVVRGVLALSSSDMTIDLRSAPIMILSLAISKSSMSTRRLLLRAAKQRRLVDQVGEVRAGEARRAARDHLGLHVGGERHLAHVHQQDLLAAADIRQRHDHLAVEAARAHQRRVEHVGPVGRGDDDHARRCPRSRPSRPAAD